MQLRTYERGKVDALLDLKRTLEAEQTPQS